MVKAAAIIPQDWIISEKSRATAGAIPKARVITGKATEPPPSLVIPVNGEKELFYIFFLHKKNVMFNGLRLYALLVELYSLR